MSQNSLGGMISEALHNIALALHFAGHKKSTVYAHRQQYLDMTKQAAPQTAPSFYAELVFRLVAKCTPSAAVILRTIPA